MSAQIDVAGPAIIMFWAPWCAPCREELRQYPQLARRAGPVPLMVAALDTPASQRTLLAGVPAERLRIVRGSSAVLLPRWSPGTSGLPLTVAIDAHGRVCATVGAKLTEDAIQDIRRRCAMTG